MSPPRNAVVRRLPARGEKHSGRPVVFLDRLLRQRGFSLLEVLIAFSILAISLGVMMRIHSGALNGIETARTQSEALEIAQSLLARASGETPLAASETSGRFGDQFAWRIAVTPFLGERLSGGALWEIDVRVTWRENLASRPREVALKSLRVGART